MFKLFFQRSFKYLHNKNIKGFCTDNTASHTARKNRLTFIFLTSSLGGGLMGYSIATYIQTQTIWSEDLEKESKNNQMDFKGEWNNNWDKKQHLYEKATKNNKKLGTKYITLIRHGQYKLEKGKDKKVLTDLGIKQAQIVGQKLQSLDLNFQFIYTSTLIRAIETANIVKEFFPTVEVQQDGLLSEGYPCSISPTREDLNYINEKSKLDKNGPRLSQGFEKYINRCDDENDRHELYVIHGNVIRYFVLRSLQLPVERWLQFSIFNTGITRIAINGSGSVSCRQLGDVGHLSKDQITYH